MCRYSSKNSMPLVAIGDNGFLETPFRSLKVEGGYAEIPQRALIEWKPKPVKLDSCTQF